MQIKILRNDPLINNADEKEIRRKETEVYNGR